MTSSIRSRSRSRRPRFAAGNEAPPERQCAPGTSGLASALPSRPDEDRERAWAVEGLRQALTRATMQELTGLASQLEPLAAAEGNVASWLLVLVADEMLRQRRVSGECRPRAARAGD